MKDKRQIFDLVLKHAREASKIRDVLYAQGIDLLNCDMFDSTSKISDTLIDQTFGDNASEELGWWLYDCGQIDNEEWDNDYFTGPDGVPIILDTDDKFYDWFSTQEEFISHSNCEVVGYKDKDGVFHPKTK